MDGWSRGQGAGILPDPRAEPAKRHQPPEIITLPTCAVICAADTWADVELLGQRKEAWLRLLLALPHGILSRDTFGRVFAALDPPSSRLPLSAGCRRWRRPSRGN